MDQIKKNKTEVLIKQLADILKSEVDKAISEGKLTPKEQLFYRTEIDGFEYTDEGPKIGRQSNQHIVKQDWLSSSFGTILQSIKELDIFRSLIDNLISDPAIEKTSKIKMHGDLINFTNELVECFLPNSDFNDDDVNDLLSIFIKKIYSEPLSFVTEIKLTNIIVLTSNLEFTVPGIENISLRRITSKDLEVEFPASRFLFGDVEPYVNRSIGSYGLPSAILEIKTTARKPDELVKDIKQSVTILRLFGTADIDIMSHKIFTDPHVRHSSFGSLSSTLTGIDRYLKAFGNYRVTEDNAKKLIQFWKELSPKLSEKLFHGYELKKNHLAITYERYSDALLLPFEPRISNAVMGLEALLLDGHGELSFRLRTLASKLLGSIGYDPIEIRQTVKKAYDIRSTYVHGGYLEEKDKNKLIRDYSSLNGFSKRILDILRVILISMLMVDSTKRDFIELANSSLISSEKDEELSNILKSTKSILE